MVSVQRLWLCFLLVGACHTFVYGQPRTVTPNLAVLLSNGKLTIVNRGAEVLNEPNYTGISLNKHNGYGLVWLPGITLTDGTIDFDVRGQNIEQQSFVGLAFKGQTDRLFEAVYFRVFNFLSSDADKHRQMVQYISLPDNDWEKLRSTAPGKYENTVTPIPDPNQWFHVTIKISGPKVSVFVDHSLQASLTVTRLSAAASGKIGFFVGNGSGGDFANLKIVY